LRLIRCRKCGTAISSFDNYFEQMILAMGELNQKALKCHGSDRNLYLQQIAQLKSMIKQVQHLSGQIEERKTTVLCELSEIVHFLRENVVIADSTLSYLKEIGRKKAKIKNQQDEAKINAIYGDFENIFTNKTKRDETANRAIGATAKAAREATGEG